MRSATDTPTRSVAMPFVPVPCRVVERFVETDDVVTLIVKPPIGSHLSWRPGQFNMVTAFGIGEIAVSVASAPGEGGTIRHTVRDVGAVSHALCGMSVGSTIGLRGAYGTDWGVDNVGSADVVVVAGGIGLAPLRGAVFALAQRVRVGGGRLFLAIGARLPDQMIFGDDLTSWRAAGVQVEVTVDAAEPGWDGHVGLVTTLLPALDFDPAGTIAMLCGPEIMMRFVTRCLVDRGVSPGRIRVSLERNMQCGIGICGHCQLGPLLICRDGPVVTYEGVGGLMQEREL